MKNNLLITIYLFIIIFFTSFGRSNNNQQKRTFSDISFVKETLKVGINSELDTIIFINKSFVFDFTRPAITDSLAKEVLYEYYRKRGYLIQEELIGNENDNLLCIRYNKIFQFQRRDNYSNLAIISYWISPPNSSGHCFQPSKAIVFKTDNGFEISNQEFIPTNYAIDSVSVIENNPTIYGYDYDCNEQNVIRDIRITLKK
ncbi:MAG: hypothetical protein HXX09_09065 [Bacteroidetes bacterium]|nr:hypothetical protein [Bacteroidota bacterium]